MKKLLIVLLTLLTLQINSKAVEPSEPPTFGRVVITGLVAGSVLMCAYDYLNTSYPSFKSTNGLYISTGADPKMAYNENSYDGLYKIGYQYDQLQFYGQGEYFNNLNYQSLGFGMNFIVINRKASLSFGPEYNRITRPWKSFNSTGININLNYNFNHHLAIELNSNFKTRPDITKKWMYNTGLLLTYKFNNKRNIFNFKKWLIENYDNI